MSSAANTHGFKVKVTDFGLARQMDFNSRIQTQTSGTVGYMAVEVTGGRLMASACAAMRCLLKQGHSAYPCNLQWIRTSHAKGSG